jgi:hypothetical protein
MNDRLIDPIVAVILGTGVGLLLSVCGQKLLNKHYQNTCHQKPTHSLVLSRGFLGDTYYCIDKAYLGPSK